MTAVRLRPFAKRVVRGPHLAPSAFIIGAAKAGTSALFDYLVVHPAIGGWRWKEAHYFDLRYALGDDWYRALFPRERELSGGRRVALDATPYYVFHPLVPTRLHAFEPDARLIVLLRDPVERAYSHWWMNRRFGLEKLGFAEALAAEPKRLQGERERLVLDPDSVSAAHQHQSYAARGHYAEQLEHWLDVFPREQLLVLFSAELAADAKAVVNGVLAFLGLPSHDLDAYPRISEGGYSESPPPKVVAALRDEFAAPDAALARLLGRPLPWRPDA